MVRIYAVLVATMLCSMAAAGDATEKERFSHGLSLVAEQPDEAFAIMDALAREGYSRAMDRLGYFHLNGIGVEKDLEKAAGLYRRAADAGHTRSLVTLGKVQLMLGDAENALATLESAVAAGAPKAVATLAWAHATRRLMHLSEPEAGTAELLDLAAKDDRDAQIHLLAAARVLPSADLVSGALLDRLHDRVREGDAKAAEALLRYYRLMRPARSTVGVRAELLDTPGIRAKVATEEGLYLALEREPQRFWLISEDIVRQTSGEVFARALVITAKINRNAYVRILHKELDDLGYDMGDFTSYLSNAQINGVDRFCRDHQIKAACDLGPLKSSAIKALASQIAVVREQM